METIFTTIGMWKARGTLQDDNILQLNYHFRML